MLNQVNPLHPALTEMEAFALTRMLEKREQYVGQGRADAAHGIGTGIWILWQALMHGQQRPTGYGDLNGI
jgi:hypothetical protein